LTESEASILSLHFQPDGQAQVEDDFSNLTTLIERERLNWEALVANHLKERQEDAER
jgi:hypothetical protein